MILSFDPSARRRAGAGTGYRRDTCPSIPRGLGHLPGDGRDLAKATAIGEFMAEAPFCGRTPVFLGDSCTDKHGFQIVNRLSAWSVKVGPGRSAACYRLASSAAVREWLYGYLKWITCHRSAGRGTAT